MRVPVCMLLLCCSCATSTSSPTPSAPAAAPAATPACSDGSARCGERAGAAPKASEAPVRTESFVLATPAGDTALQTRLQKMGEAEVRRCWEADKTTSGQVTLRVKTTMTESNMGVTLAVKTTDEGMKRCLKAGARVWVFRMGAMDASGAFAYGTP